MDLNSSEVVELVVGLGMSSQGVAVVAVVVVVASVVEEQEGEVAVVVVAVLLPLLQALILKSPQQRVNSSQERSLWELSNRCGGISTLKEACKVLSPQETWSHGIKKGIWQILL